MSEVGMKRFEVFLEAGDVALDGEIEADDLLAVRAEDEDVGLADRLAEQVDAPRRARHRIGDGRVGDQDVVGVGRQVDDDRLVEAELDALALAVGDDLRRVGKAWPLEPCMPAPSPEAPAAATKQAGRATGACRTAQQASSTG